jgi:superfamily I DNA/RNA helicase
MLPTEQKLIVPSPEQYAVGDWILKGTGSALVEAVAGSGKTKVLLGGLPRTRGNVAFCAYNKAIVKEIESRSSPMQLGDRLNIGTVHSFGYKILRSAYPKIELDGYSKLKKIANFLVKNPYLRTFAINTASKAKQIGIGIFSDVDDISAWRKMVDHFSLDQSLPKNASLGDGIKEARAVLKESNRTIPKLIDFDDMVYGPVLLGLKSEQYQWVLLDEAQDTNPVRRKLIKMMLAPGGRLIAVGDSHQSINAYTGADHNAMELIASEFNTTRFPLSTTFRCPKLIVKEAQRWVPHIKAFEDAPDGVVDSIILENLLKSPKLNPDDAILCRVTKPLVDLAFKLIKKDVACRVEGRAIGEGLIKLINRWECEVVSELNDKVDSWYVKALSKAREDEDYSKCGDIEEQAETLKVLMDQCKIEDPISVLIEKIKYLFGDSDSSKGQSVLTLSTVHRSKGKEWNHVYALGMNAYSPSKWAKKDWEIIQEHNLCYVQVTRAKEHLTYIDVPSTRNRRYGT